MILLQILEVSLHMRSGLTLKARVHEITHRPGLTVELADAVITASASSTVSRMAIERASGKIETCDGYDHHPFGTVLIEKMDFNANREDHKIENRRGPNGKRI